jgi:hypothetical protein
MLLHLFVVKFILVSSFFGFLHNIYYLMKEAKIIVAMDDLDFEIRDVTF